MLSMLLISILSFQASKLGTYVNDSVIVPTRQKVPHSTVLSNTIRHIVWCVCVCVCVSQVQEGNLWEDVRTSASTWAGKVSFLFAVSLVYIGMYPSCTHTHTHTHYTGKESRRAGVDRFPILHRLQT